MNHGELLALGIQSLSENCNVARKYFAFRRWLDTPNLSLRIWHDWMPRGWGLPRCLWHDWVGIHFSHVHPWTRGWVKHCFTSVGLTTVIPLFIFKVQIYNRGTSQNCLPPQTPNHILGIFIYGVYLHIYIHTHLICTYLFFTIYTYTLYPGLLVGPYLQDIPHVYLWSHHGISRWLWSGHCRMHCLLRRCLAWSWA